MQPRVAAMFKMACENCPELEEFELGTSGTKRGCTLHAGCFTRVLHAGRSTVGVGICRSFLY